MFGQVPLLTDLVGALLVLATVIAITFEKQVAIIIVTIIIIANIIIKIVMDDLDDAKLPTFCAKGFSLSTSQILHAFVGFVCEK